MRYIHDDAGNWKQKDDNEECLEEEEVAELAARGPFEQLQPSNEAGPSRVCKVLNAQLIQ